MLFSATHAIPIFVVCIVIVKLLRRRWSAAYKQAAPAASPDRQELISINVAPADPLPSQQQFAIQLPLKMIGSATQGHSPAFLVDLQDDSSRGIYKPLVNDLNEAPSMTRRGVMPTDGACNEVAAFYLDHNGLAGVPKTSFVIRDGQPAGSVQTFVSHFDVGENISPSMLSVDNVHAIALLDLRLCNLDRHLGNLLCCRVPGEDRVMIVPIDHSLILPDYRCMSDAWFAWYSWRHSSVPFSSDLALYIAVLDPLADVPVLQRIGLRTECIVAYLIASRFVKVALANGSNLRQMAEFMQRVALEPDRPSALENVVADAIRSSKFQHTSLVSIDNWDRSSDLHRFLDDIQERITMSSLINESLTEYFNQLINERF